MQIDRVGNGIEREVKEKAMHRWVKNLTMIPKTPVLLPTIYERDKPVNAKYEKKKKGGV